jgi:pimeloyl-ACP methyl ester carboxylesterase
LPTNRLEFTFRLSLDPSAAISAQASAQGNDHTCSAFVRFDPRCANGQDKTGTFYAYVGTGQVADFPIKSDSATYEALLKKAKALSDPRAIEELSHVGPPPYNSGEGFRVQHKWANAFEGADEFLYGTLGLALVAPGYSLQDINDSGDGQILSADRLVPEAQSIGPAELGPEFSIPMFVFQGEEDFTTSTALARHYAESIKALRKEFVPIKGGGQFAVFIRSDQFLQELITRVRPLAVGH